MSWKFFTVTLTHQDHPRSHLMVPMDNLQDRHWVQRRTSHGHRLQVMVTVLTRCYFSRRWPLCQVVTRFIEPFTDDKVHPISQTRVPGKNSKPDQDVVCSGDTCEPGKTRIRWWPLPTMRTSGAKSPNSQACKKPQATSKCPWEWSVVCIWRVLFRGGEFRKLWLLANPLDMYKIVTGFIRLELFFSTGMALSSKRWLS